MGVLPTHVVTTRIGWSCIRSVSQLARNAWNSLGHAVSPGPPDDLLERRPDAVAQDVVEEPLPLVGTLRSLFLRRGERSLFLAGASSVALPESVAAF